MINKIAFSNLAISVSIVLWFNILINLITLFISKVRIKKHQLIKYNFSRYTKLNLSVNHFLAILSIVLLISNYLVSFAVIIPINILFFNLIFTTFAVQYIANIYLWHFSLINLIE